MQGSVSGEGGKLFLSLLKIANVIASFEPVLGCRLHSTASCKNCGKNLKCLTSATGNGCGFIECSDLVLHIQQVSQV